MRRFASAFGLGFGICLAAATTFSATAADPPPQEIQEADILRLNQAMTPGPMHQLLARFAGSWTFEGQVWLKADLPPTAWSGTCEKAMILGGRYLEEQSRGSFLGAPTEGRALFGWDQLGKIFQGLWIDNGGTAMLSGDGRLEADGTTITFAAERKTPLTERRDRLRLVYRLEDDDHVVFESIVEASKGQPERRQAIVRYTRVRP